MKTMFKFFNMVDFNSCAVPMLKVTDFHSSGSQSETLESTRNLQKLTGAMMYLSATKSPYVSYSTSYLSHGMEAPTVEMWTLDEGLLLYLKGTYNLVLKFNKGGTEKSWATVIKIGNRSSQPESPSVVLFSCFLGPYLKEEKEAVCCFSKNLRSEVHFFGKSRTRISLFTMVQHPVWNSEKHVSCRHW